MANRGNDQAQAGAKLGLNTAQQGYGSLMPALQADITNPTGFSETDLARANTAAQESAGGTQAGAVGQGALMEGRTRNPGSARSAIAQSARNAGEQLSQNALGVRMKDAELKESKRAAGKGLLGQVSGQALGSIAPNVQADNAAKEQSWGWARNVFQPLLSAASNSKRF